jgi:hypothetical protein
MLNASKSESMPERGESSLHIEVGYEWAFGPEPPQAGNGGERRVAPLKEGEGDMDGCMHGMDARISARSEADEAAPPLKRARMEGGARRENRRPSTDN